MEKTRPANVANDKLPIEKPLPHNGTRDLRYAAIKEHLFSNLNDEAVVLSVKSGKYYGLKGAGVAIWRAVGNPATIAEICSSVMNEYEVGMDKSQQEIEGFLEKLIDEGLIEVSNERPA